MEQCILSDIGYGKFFIPMNQSMMNNHLCVKVNDKVSKLRDGSVCMVVDLNTGHKWDMQGEMKVAPVYMNNDFTAQGPKQSQREPGYKPPSDDVVEELNKDISKPVYLIYRRFGQTVEWIEEFTNNDGKLEHRWVNHSGEATRFTHHGTAIFIANGLGGDVETRRRVI